MSGGVRRACRKFTPVYDREAPKKATNLSLNRDLLAQFDADVNPDKSTRAFFFYVVDIQNSAISQIASRIVSLRLNRV